MDNRNQFKQPLPGDVPDILAVIPDGTGIVPLGAGQQVQQRGFAAAAFPQDGIAAARRQGQGEIPQDLLPFAVGNGYIVRLHLFPAGNGPVLPFRLGKGQHAVVALHQLIRGLHVRQQLRHGHRQLHDVGHQLGKGDDHTYGHRRIIL